MAEQFDIDEEPEEEILQAPRHLLRGDWESVPPRGPSKFWEFVITAIIFFGVGIVTFGTVTIIFHKPVVEPNWLLVVDQNYNNIKVLSVSADHEYVVLVQEEKLEVYRWTTNDAVVIEDLGPGQDMWARVKVFKEEFSSERKMNLEIHVRSYSDIKIHSTFKDGVQ